MPGYDHLNFPGDYKLDEIKIINAVGEPLTLRMGQVQELNIYEDINSSSLTGSMSIIDAHNIITQAQLQGNERLIFKLHTLIPLIIVAVRIPVTLPAGAELTPMVGIALYPPPLLLKVINLIDPSVLNPTTALAVAPVPTSVRVWEDPRSVDKPSSEVPSALSPIRVSSISETPVSITSSS